MKKKIVNVILTLFILLSAMPGNMSVSVLAEDETMFDKYIPVAQVYAINTDPFNVEAGDTVQGGVSTKYFAETEKGRYEVKRADNKDGFIKVSYVGKFGELDMETAVDYMNICSEEHYLQITGDPNAPEPSYKLSYTLTKDTLIVSLDLYDKDKNLVCNLSPASIIMAANKDGEFITYSRHKGYGNNYYISFNNTIYSPDEDVTFNKGGKYVNFKADYVMLDNLEMAEGLMRDGVLKSDAEKYKFITHEPLGGTKQHNTNKIISYNEFLTPDNTYYQIGRSDGIDPVIRNRIPNVVSYTSVPYVLGTVSKRRIITADGTLFDVSLNTFEKTVVAKNVKKATTCHYLTNDGKVIEAENNKVIATDCKDMDESYIHSVIGVIKNDDTFWMGTSYLGDAKTYEKGLQKKLDNAKMLVPDGVVDKDNTFYRWSETVFKSAMDENAWSEGKFVQDYELKHSVIRVCDNAERIFTNDLLEMYGGRGNDTGYERRVTGFVVNNRGDFFGYSITNHVNFKMKLGMVERIFPMFESNEDGTFVGVKVEGEDVPYVIVSKYYDNNVYKMGRAVYVDPETLETVIPRFVAETRGGYVGHDGRVYSVKDDVEKSTNGGDISVYPNLHADLGAMHRGMMSFRAFSRTKDAITLLPSISNWAYDSKGIILLERTDGSMWASVIYNLDFATDIAAQLDGYENTNAIQITPPTKSKAAPEYISVNGEKTVPQKQAFTDVHKDAYYASAVSWAVENGITSGTSATTFSPDDTCTRAQILTFLWRAAGAPMPAKENPFTDVKSSDYYYYAAVWANEMKMVTGKSFNGDTSCTREDTVIYLWKNAGTPFASNTTSAFSDVKAGTQCENAVLWAVENGITSGTSETTFSPDSTCTRGQIVTFLNRAIK